MNRSSFIASFATVVAILFGISSQISRAKEASYDKIEKELAKKVHVKSQVATLQKLATTIAEKVKIRVTFDKQGLEKLGIDTDEEVRLPDTEVTLRSFLAQTLTSHNDRLRLAVLPDSLQFTSYFGDERPSLIHIRTYDVRDLLQSDAQPAKNPNRPKAKPLAAQQEVASDLSRLIVCTIDPASWDDVGGPASLKHKDGVLQISQTSDRQVRIKVLLNNLRRIKVQQKKSPGGKSAIIGEHVAGAKARDEILAKLKTKQIAINFDKVKLRDVVQKLQQDLGVPVALDHYHLTEDGGPVKPAPADDVDPFGEKDNFEDPFGEKAVVDDPFGDVAVSADYLDTEVSMKTAKLPARDALTLLLHKIDQDWSYIIRNEMLVITTKEGADYDITTRIYPVADLLLPRQPPADGSRSIDYDDLIELIQSNIAPESWDEVGGPGSVAEFESLSAPIISQSDGIHEKIEDLLTKLRSGSIKMPAPKPAERLPARNGVDPINSATPAPAQANGPEGIEEVHLDERAAVLVLRKKTFRGRLDKEGHVVRLWFSDRVAGAELERLKELSQLSDLIFREGSITNAELMHLAGLNSLQYLFLAGPQITNEGLVHLTGLPQLTNLRLSDTKVTDDGLIHLKQLKQLQHFGFFGRGMTGKGLIHLQGVPHLSSLVLTGADFTDDGLAALRDNPRLTHMSLYEVGITDAGIAHVGTLKQLAYLDLDRTKITDSSMYHLRNLERLEDLNISQTAITDIALAEIKKCRSLRVLDLRDTKVTAAGLDQLLELKNLETLWVTADGKITPEAIDKFKTAFFNHRTDNDPRHVKVNPRMGLDGRGMLAAGAQVFRRKERKD